LYQADFGEDAGMDLGDREIDVDDMERDMDYATRKFKERPINQADLNGCIRDLSLFRIQEEIPYRKAGIF
jgi:hypothetical protein